MTSTVRAGLIGAGIGGASMFLLDPDRGARRRALVRDKTVWPTRKTRNAASATGRDLNNRLSGLQARVRARFSDGTVDDATLAGRVRAALGRATSHSRAIRVNVSGGLVTLAGDALRAEFDDIVSAVVGVRGVESVQNQITAHAAPDGIPALQHDSERPIRRARWLRGGWSPTAILAVGTGLAAGAAAIAAMRRDRSENVADAGAVFITESGVLLATPEDSGFEQSEFFS